MDIRVKVSSARTQKSACLIVGIMERRQLSETAMALDTATSKAITAILKTGDFNGKLGTTHIIYQPAGIAASRIMLVGCGKTRDISLRKYQQIFSCTYAALKKTAVKDAVCYLTDLDIKSQNIHWKIRHAAEALHQASYNFDDLKSNKLSKTLLNAITLNTTKRDLKRAQDALKAANAIAQGVDLARTLGNLPGNICTPTYLARQAMNQAKQYAKLKVTVLNEKEMKQLKMGALLSVARGSHEAPKLIVMEYRGTRAKDKPIVLVGKGITFDSGGISIKPSAAMDEMKFDMCGAAGVIGTMKSVAELQLSINVVAIIPSCENMPDGLANKPGDIVTSMSGQTIEVLNTDAEGRLILCDALTYAAKFEPRYVIDTATLTGACVVALGSHCSALLGNNDKLKSDLLKAGETSGDRSWELPLWDDYQDQLKSNFADIANIGGREAGTITAACFLSRFTKKYKWAHIDIAGIAWNSGNKKGATGRPVPLLTQYLIDRS